MSDRPSSHTDWRAKLRVSQTCLAAWAFLSRGLWIIPRPALAGSGTGISGLWSGFAQPGAILVALALIFPGVAGLNLLDRDHGLNE